MKFERMPCGAPTAYYAGADDERALDVLWPDWRAFTQRHGALPPLDDVTVEHAVREGRAPAWILDGVDTVRAFGGRAWRWPEDRAHIETMRGPIVVKPTWNPAGLGRGLRQFERAADLRGSYVAGDLVQPWYVGPHVSRDIVVERGILRWTVTADGYRYDCPPGQFAAWRVRREIAVHPPIRPPLQLSGESGARLMHYTGVLNVETVGGEIIEVHFRPSLELFPLYGPLVIDALLLAGLGRSPPPPPEACGGWMQVIPRAARIVDVERELAEWSWRAMLAYSPARRG